MDLADLLSETLSEDFEICCRSTHDTSVEIYYKRLVGVWFKLDKLPEISIGYMNPSFNICEPNAIENLTDTIKSKIVTDLLNYPSEFPIPHGTTNLRTMIDDGKCVSKVLSPEDYPTAVTYLWSGSILIDDREWKRGSWI